MIQAKPIVDNRYWILKEDDRKVGTVEAHNNNVVVRINNTTQHFKSIGRLSNIQFEPAYKTTKMPRDQAHGYETGCRAHNAMWDVRRRLPLFTKSSKSKSWYAAGWYSLQQSRRWSTVRNPKLILLDRYKYHGPFHTQKEADEHTHTQVR
jgi:hypothetical protein